MTIKQKQCLLAYLGYYTGEIDGLWGPKSQEATEAFQRDYQLTVDGIFGNATAARILEVIASGEHPQTQAPAADPDNGTRDSANENADANNKTGTFWDGIKYFTREEFRCPCGKCGGFPVEPQENLVRAVDEMRRDFGSPVIVVPPDGHSGGSGVRCQSYNDSLSGSVPNSRHVLGKAADFSAPAVPAAKIEAYLTQIRSSGKIRYWYKICAGSYHMDVL